jgi:spoIIIJ-associated protein
MAPDPEAELRELLETISDALDLEAEVVIDAEPERLTARLVGEDLGLFIGRHGQTIDAVQHLAHRLVLKHGVEDWTVVVDAEGYRERRRIALEREADRAVEEAGRYGRPVALDAMTASERKLVHEYLRDNEAVETYSEGQEPDRHLVVAPVGAS